jgi:DNA-binding GntR family transcriptional regulator
MDLLSAAKPKPISSTEMVAGTLRDAICSGEIAPGAPLKQDDIAAEFNVSHTPVREALKALVSEGLAVLHHNRGCFVSDLSSAVARELMEFRAVLEPRLAGWAVDRLTDRDFELARAIMAKIDKSNNPALRLRLATEFHTVIYTRAERPFFLDQVSRARNNLNRYWRMAWNDSSFPANTQNEHREILELCVARDRAGAMELIERHIIASGEVVLRYLQKTEVGPTRRREISNAD